MADNLHRILLQWLALLLASVCAQLKLLPALLLRHKSPEELDLTQIHHDRKKEFLRTYAAEYGYPGGILSLDRLRSGEFKRLEAGAVYLDHAGATLHTDGQLRAVLQDLSDNLYGNPHSQNDSSTRTAELMESARSQVLKFCNASVADYKCIFTSGATSALKLVGEAFPWSSDSHYMYTMENHNSVLGLREYALEKGATVTAVDIEPSGDVPGGASSFSLRKPQRRRFSSFQDVEGEVYNLFAFPGECNFSGAKFNLQLVNDMKWGKHVTGVRGKWLVVVDAAKACGTSPPDLSRFPADFVAVSFYKIFGYPTGLGALLVRNGAANLLKKKYFGGGTVAVSIADVDFMQKRDKLEQWLEDGTPSFLAVAALRHGFSLINQLTLPAIQRHTGALTRFTAHKLMTLRHKNGKEVCTLYGTHCLSPGHPTQYWGQQCQQGPVIAFNLKRADGSWVGYREVERFAALNNIHLRGGCFCNPGACAKYIGLSHTELQQNFESGHVCWDDHDVINGKPTGAVRVSFGFMSSYEDVEIFISFIEKYFVEKTARANLSCADTQATHAINGCEPGKILGKRINPSATITLESIIVYPIKSCAGFLVQAWALSDTGLLYDREFCVVTASGNTLTQKMNPSMCLIQTWIDLANGKLHIGAPNKRKGLQVPLTSCSEDDVNNQGPGLSEFHPEVTEWLSDVLGLPCSLLRKKAKNRWTRQSKICAVPTESTSTSAMQRRELSFANEGQFLLVSQASVDDVNKRVVSSGQGSMEVAASQFRPNLVVSGGSPYAEDKWKSVKIGDNDFEVLGGCNRCTMININQSTGQRENQFEPLRTLSTYRNFKGQVNFGMLLVQENSRPITDPQNHRMLRVGSDVLPYQD